MLDDASGFDRDHEGMAREGCGDFAGTADSEVGRYTGETPVPHQITGETPVPH